jgi:predicted nuclease of predicted toxin-antitoxin system
LVDNALSPLVAEGLFAAGHVRQYGMQAATDGQIVARAAIEQCRLRLRRLPVEGGD